jgi:hypothetical protein
VTPQSSERSLAFCESKSCSIWILHSLALKVSRPLAQLYKAIWQMPLADNSFYDSMLT